MRRDREEKILKALTVAIALFLLILPGLIQMILGHAYGWIVDALGGGIIVKLIFGLLYALAFFAIVSLLGRFFDRRR